MSLAILFHFVCAQHVSDINISIIRSLRLSCWIATLVVLFLVWCVLAEACNTDTTPIQPHRNSNTHQTKNNTTNVAIQQNSRKLLMMDILMSETCWAQTKWNKIASDIKLVVYFSTITYSSSVHRRYLVNPEFAKKTKPSWKRRQLWFCRITITVNQRTTGSGMLRFYVNRKGIYCCVKCVFQWLPAKISLCSCTE